MYQFYRLDNDEHDNDVLTIVDTCAIQGDRIPSVPEKYSYVLFHLRIDPSDKIFVKTEYAMGVPESVIVEAQDWINNADDKIGLPTYFHDFIIINESERVAHLRLVYIAENEEAVWNFLNS